MRANEYFKKHGYKKCKAACAQNGWLNTGFWIQLKRLVESNELIESYEGLEDATKVCIQLHCKGEDTSKLKQAIADVESCQ